MRERRHVVRFVCTLLFLDQRVCDRNADEEPDRFMDDYHQQYPWYNFHIHKGYPTPEHLTLLDKYGPCVGHRRSFRPVRDRELGLGGDR